MHAKLEGRESLKPGWLIGMEGIEASQFPEERSETLSAPQGAWNLPSPQRSHRVCYIWEFQLGTQIFYLLLPIFETCWKFLFPTSSFQITFSHILLANYINLIHCYSFSCSLITKMFFIPFILLLDYIVILLFNYFILLSINLFNLVSVYPYCWL